jgi:OHCU decarboxylase
MRSDPRDYELIAPSNLRIALKLLGRNPGEWLPIAGGTDIMVQYAAGKLPSRKLVSVWNLPELRRIEVLPDEIRLGAGSTYTDIREHEVIAQEFSMLARAASWTGGIANQNRGTIGGNIVNASPAADSLPALLAYDAELILLSARGERRIAYAGFHMGYKKVTLAPDELIQTICLPRKRPGYFCYAQKVGSRNAQAISKICMAAMGRVAVTSAGKNIEDARIALGSVAPVPLRLRETERAVNCKIIDESLVRLARNTAIAEIKLIDDIRSTAKYRGAVAGNLISEFLNLLADARCVSDVLGRWNHAPADTAETQILPCCGSKRWAHEMAAQRPFKDDAALTSASNEMWRSLNEGDWIEAFNSHPRIGESKEQDETQSSDAWSRHEQERVAEAGDAVKIALAEGNRAYEEKFGRIFIVCATGKSGPEILALLQRRLPNDAATELHEAAEQQRQITQLRLKKWLQG